MPKSVRNRQSSVGLLGLKHHRPVIETHGNKQWVRTKILGDEVLHVGDVAGVRHNTRSELFCGVLGVSVPAEHGARGCNEVQVVMII